MNIDYILIGFASLVTGIIIGGIITTTIDEERAVAHKAATYVTEGNSYHFQWNQ